MTAHTLLVADDDALLRETLSDAFAGLGWDVRTAACGAQAISVLAHERLDLLISDVDMPDMTGFQLLSWVRSHSAPPPMPVVLMSARADAELGRAATANGAAALVAKPVAFAQLSTLINRIVL
jgi:CheY-like chemotaxis protein